MITLQRNKQKMFYSLQGSGQPIYETDEDGNIKYYLGVPLDTGSIDDSFQSPVEFRANISNELDKSLVQSFGIDDSTNYAKITTTKGYLPIKKGDVIWKKSDIGYKLNENGEEVVDEDTADYKVIGVANEGLNTDLFMLQKIVK